MQQRIVSGEVFAALEIPVLAGRSFDARDDASAPSPRGGQRQLRSARHFQACRFDAVIGQRIPLADGAARLSASWVT